MTTDYDQNDPPARRQLVKWIPDFSSGNLGLILTIAGMIYHFGGEMKSIRQELEAMKATNVVEAVRDEKTITEMKMSVGAVDLKIGSVQEKLGTMAVTLAEIRATQQQRGSK